MRNREQLIVCILTELDSQGELFEWERPLVLILAEKYLDLSSDHDLFHSIRVRRLAVQIADRHGGDIESLVAAAYLHDVASDSDRLNHVELGIMEARATLPRVKFPQDKLETVLECIEWHEQYDWIGEVEVTKMPVEALIFQDADRLDALGTIGIARTFTFGGARRIPIWLPHVGTEGHYDPRTISISSVEHLRSKILRLEETLHTEFARSIARGRTDKVVEFLDHFMKEWQGLV